MWICTENVSRPHQPEDQEEHPPKYHHSTLFEVESPTSRSHSREQNSLVITKIGYFRTTMQRPAGASSFNETQSTLFAHQNTSRSEDTIGRGGGDCSLYVDWDCSSSQSCC